MGRQFTFFTGRQVNFYRRIFANTRNALFLRIGNVFSSDRGSCLALSATGKTGGRRAGPCWAPWGMARALGVQSCRAVFFFTGSLSAEPEPSRSMETYSAKTEQQVFRVCCVQRYSSHLAWSPDHLAPRAWSRGHPVPRPSSRATSVTLNSFFMPRRCFCVCFEDEEIAVQLVLLRKTSHTISISASQQQQQQQQQQKQLTPETSFEFQELPRRILVQVQQERYSCGEPHVGLISGGTSVLGAPPFELWTPPEFQVKPLPEGNLVLFAYIYQVYIILSIPVYIFYKMLKNISCEYNRLNG